MMHLPWIVGDHEQLRPKAEEYGLTVASGRGYDLDLSLFERLQGQGFPVASLVLQRRMQPDRSRARARRNTGEVPVQHQIGNASFQGAVRRKPLASQHARVPSNNVSKCHAQPDSVYMLPLFARKRGRNYQKSTDSQKLWLGLDSRLH